MEELFRDELSKKKKKKKKLEISIIITINQFLIIYDFPIKIFPCNANNSNFTHSSLATIAPKLCSTLVSLRSKRIGGPKREHLTPSIRIPRLILFSRKRVFKTV